MEQNLKKTGITQWYDRNRWRVFLVTFALSVVICVMFAIANTFNMVKRKFNKKS